MQLCDTIFYRTLLRNVFHQLKKWTKKFNRIIKFVPCDNETETDCKDKHHGHGEFYYMVSLLMITDANMN